ncbi:xanthine dehydrogenase accessory protein XdhC [Telmatospirillum siberiense]|uniref:Xanthine dehydrogenase accessory protein XdhC n=1 Tax=Telmatospirillum siberiense TaxID=382514 RepID=A0A2N3PVS3_9PROT|nr:xanthine dehydrogenase accessory protein XdhC [Telmatospirillum siberiense]PKU24488.1 xanthine dehydrogenase accessory protein XdhC [Telmatospirillum siberiense]
MSDWLTTLAELDTAGVPHVLVTQVEILGSAPREAGAKMVVTSDQLYGSIGGGSLEFQAAAIARGMLGEGQRAPRIEKSILGPDMRQCCGGAVTLLFEPFHPAAFTLALFGAGHVARALVHVLEGVPLRLLWIDERQGLFPANPPGFVRVLSPPDPLTAVAQVPAGAHVLVMTHSHERDFQLVRALAGRQDLAGLGLIGSQTKWARFRRRLAEDGLTSERIAEIRCPIGLPGLKGKRPAEIAIAIAAQLLIETSEGE